MIYLTTRIMQKINKPAAEKIAILRRNSYFAEVSAEILRKIADATDLRIYNPGEVIFWEGEACAGLHILQSGSVKLFKISRQGRELILRILEEGATFNGVPVFDNGLNPLNVAALEHCEIWVADVQVIRECMHTHPELAQSVITNLCSNLRTLVEMVEELSFYQVTNRLARLIEELPRERLEGDIDQRLTQDQMAAHLGTVREVVGRALRTLERSGAIQVSRGRIQVVDLGALKSWSQNTVN